MNPPIVHYRYTDPSPAGPFKGKVTWDGSDRLTTGPIPQKGDILAMPFGRAEVTSIIKRNPTRQ